MADARTSDHLLKFAFGQHILNGFSVGVGVGFVTLVASLWLGFVDGMAVGLGAICVSIADIPNPLASKIKILPVSWLLACLSSLLTALTVGEPWERGLVVLAVSFGAGLLVGYGRWALPVSVLTQLALVFTLGAPLAGLADALHRELLFVAGGFAYMLVAFATTRATERSGRRVAVAECLREFAAYLRVMASFYDADADLAGVYRRVIEQQAALADHLQAARQQVFLGRRTESAKRLAGALILQIDALDALVSAHADYAPLRRQEAGPVLPRLFSALARDMGDDLSRLALDLLRGRRGLTLRDRQAALDRIGAEVAALSHESGVPPRALRAARATRTKFSWVSEHLRRLPKVMQTAGAADTLLRGIDLNAFLQPLSLSPRQLLRHFDLSSPVLRHAIRLSAAMSTGYLLICLVPSLNHGNWILLTIAVILRAQYSVTRQRRNDRLIGNLIGCLIAALLLKLAPAGLQLAIIPLAIGIGQAYARVNYLLTSVAACVMAILSLHFLDPVEAPAVLDRLTDTVIGAAIAFLFSRLLPRWEYHEAPKLVAQLMKSFTAYMAVALRRDIADQDYRLARKTMLEALAAITESAARVGGEPAHVQSVMPDLGTLLSAAYSLAAQMVGIRSLLTNRRAEIDPTYADDLLQRTRQAVLGQLDLTRDNDVRFGLEAEDDASLEADKALKLRCAELYIDAVRLHSVAERYL